MGINDSINERRLYAEACDYTTQKRYAALYGGDMQKVSNTDYWQIIEGQEVVERSYPHKYGWRYTRYFLQEVTRLAIIRHLG